MDLVDVLHIFRTAAFYTLVLTFRHRASSM